MATLERQHGETTLDYHKRLIWGKLVDKTLCDVSYSDLSQKVYGQRYAPDVARRMMYGSRRTLELLSNYDSDVDNRILALSDFHVPFNVSLDKFSTYAGKVDALVLNGDIEDCQSISKFTKLYRVELIDEMVQTRKLILDLVELIRPKRLYITVGNHEKRLGRTLANAVGAEVMGLMPDTPLDLIVRDGFRKRDRFLGTDMWYDPIEEVLTQRGVEVHFDGEWFCKVGHTIFAHPVSYSSGMLKTTEKAVNYFLRLDRDFNALVLGHTHKMGSYYQGGIAMYEQGCCCDLSRLNYTEGQLMIPNQAGFLYLCHDAEGDIIQDKTKLVRI